MFLVVGPLSVHMKLHIDDGEDCDTYILFALIVLVFCFNCPGHVMCLIYSLFLLFFLAFPSRMHFNITPPHSLFLSSCSLANWQRMDMQV